MKAVGARLPRYDGLGHVTGRTQFVDDVRVGRTLWVKALRSPHHHAAIASIDTAKAEKLKGVHAIVTCADVPKNVYGHLEALGGHYCRCTGYVKIVDAVMAASRGETGAREDEPETGEGEPVMIPGSPA